MKLRDSDSEPLDRETDIHDVVPMHGQFKDKPETQGVKETPRDFLHGLNPPFQRSKTANAFNQIFARVPRDQRLNISINVTN